MDLLEILLISSTVLMLPVIMVIFGWVFRTHPPKDINWVYGYRTKRSVSSQEAWDFAHAHIGKVWTYAGAVMLPASAVSLLFLLNTEGYDYWIAGMLLLFAEMGIMVGTIPLTESALKKELGV